MSLDCSQHTANGLHSVWSLSRDGEHYNFILCVSHNENGTSITLNRKDKTSVDELIMWLTYEVKWTLIDEVLEWKGQGPWPIMVHKERILASLKTDYAPKCKSSEPSITSHFDASEATADNTSSD